MLRSNLNSPLQKELQNLGFHNPYSEKVLTNYPIGIRKYISESFVELTSPDIYGSRRTIDIPMGRGRLSQIQIKFTITSDGDNSIVEPFLAGNILKFVFLETRSCTKTLQTFTPLYTTARIDSSTKERIDFFANSMCPNTTMTNGVTAYCYLTLFGNFSEHPSKFLDTDHLEPLQLTFWTQDSYSEMGLSADISYLKIEPIFTYFETSIKMPKYVGNYLTHDSVEEKPVELTVGSTFTDIQIKNRRSVFCMHLLIKNNNFEFLQVNSFDLISLESTIISYSRQNMIDLWSETSGNTENTFTYWFSMNKNRYDNTMSLNLYHLFPLTLRVYHNTVSDAGYYLNVLFEYNLINKIDDVGGILRVENY